MIVDISNATRKGWEVLNEDKSFLEGSGSYAGTARMPVVGGWLYRETVVIDGAPAVSICFVADAKAPPAFVG